ncbi:hypothetical protein GR268_46355, partial [Rhizobium leguminosarum]|nr:hypothetical protein [Rhizobium leguminosarum]
ILQRLSKSSDNSAELQAGLDKRLKEIAENLEKLQATHDKLTQETDLLPDTEDAVGEGEEAAYEDLTQYFKNPADAAELANNAQTAVEDLLQQLGSQSKEGLISQAKELSDALSSLVKNMQSQHAHIQEVYEDNDASDYLQQHAQRSQ